MSISEFLTRICIQDLVYWPLVSIDEYNRETFGTAVEIKGRWEDVKELTTNAKGEEVVSMARAWVLQDLAEGGYLYLGTTSDSGYNADPTEMDGALRIIAFKKTPALGSASVFNRRVHMNMGRNTTV